MNVKDLLNEYITDTEKPCAIHEYAFISPDALNFSENVRKACEANYCGRYGKCWTCPPGVGDWEVWRDYYKKYSNAFVFTTCHQLEDSFDIEGMEDGRKLHDLLDSDILNFLKKNSVKCELIGAGSCSLCEKCTYPDAPCRQPERARRSMEAVGIDVVELSRTCNIHYINGEATVTYFSVIFW